MRPSFLSVLVLGLLAFSERAQSSQGHQRREVASSSDANPTSQTSQTETADRGSATPSAVPSSFTTSISSTAGDGDSSAGAPETMVTITSSTASTSPDARFGPSATPIVNGSLVQHPNVTSPFQKGQLPIEPTVTPAVATAGAIMMISGILFTLIGIKTKWLHISLSSAYLVNLAVTVLIVYVCHPPVSNAVQGAYLVAIVITGLIFGGGSIIFPDVAEGLGCLLGGFALSMWFLVLTPGGLIKSTAGKAVFIACFMVAAFAFYFSHWTRSYGQIGSISFAGATVVVLGIDCFSRAGLKEFWLYIWNLNSNIFPKDYDQPYPITRGIRVEIAGIFILSLLGIMSQIKVWKIIKKRREARIAAQNDVQMKKDEAEGELGRQLEEGNGRDKTLWEKAFGGNEKARHVDSGIGTDESGHSRKGSGTIANTSEGDKIEMNNIKAPSIMSGKSAGKLGHCPQVTVRVAEEDEASGLGLADYADWRSRPSTDRDGVSTQVGAIKAPSVKAESVKPASISASSAKSSASPKQQASRSDALPKSGLLESEKTVPGPSIPALPFKIGDHIEDEDDVGSERSSIATFAASDRLPSRLSKRLSGNRLHNRLSQGSRKSLVASPSEEALVVPHDDDQESSAVADVGELETSSLSSKPLSKSRSHEQNSLSQPFGLTDTDPKVLTLADLPGLSRPEGLSSQAKPAKQASASGDEGAKVTPEQQEEYRAPSTLQPHLPDNAPKIVTTYRTNEWAKHLDQAEAPVAQAATSEPSNPQDQPAPVLVKELRQTPLTAEPKPAAITKTRSQEKLREKASKPRLSARLSSYLTAPSRAASQTSLRDMRDPEEQAQNSTNPSAQNNSRAFRSSSQPLLTSSPATIDEDEETYFPPRASPLPSSSMGVRLSSNDTLISQRHSKVSNRASATNFAQQQPQEYSNPRRQSNTTGFPLTNIRRSTSSTLSNTAPSPYNNNPISPPSSSTTRLSHHQQYNNNHAPAHHPTPQSSLISDWRTSLAAESSNPQKQQLDEMEFRRQELLREKKNNNKRVSSSSLREQGMGATTMGNNRRVSSGSSGAGGGNGMLGGRRMSAKDLAERHREAMRRMQGSVRI